MRSEQEMANGQYFDYADQSYPPGSPDTFFAQVNVHPPTSDSNQTPPSPTYSKSRRTVARPSHAHAPSTQQSSTSYSTHRNGKSTREPSSRFRRERERQLANTPREALLQLVIVKEHEYTEAKHLLTTAILQVESLKDRLSREEKARKTLEEETRTLGLKTTKAILDSQSQTIRSQEDIGYYKLQLQNTERQLRHVNERLRVVEKERDEADRALVRARSTARQLKEDNVIYKAREEGRQEGFEEGLRQGRLQQDSLAEGSETKPRKKERKPPAPVGPTPEQEQALKALRDIDEREKLRIHLQLSDAERKLDAERQNTKDLSRLLKISAAEKSKLEQDNQKLEKERDQARRALEALEREKEELKRREAETLKRASSDRRRLTEENEREKREIVRERERAEREKRELEEKAREEVERERERARKAEEDRERDREREREREKEREKEREREQKEKAKETSATIAAATAAVVSAVVGATSSHSSPEHTQPQVHDYRNQPYIPMPAPPVGAIPIDMPTPVVMPAPDISSSDASRNAAGYQAMPRAGSSGSQRGYPAHPRRDSFSSATSTQFDLLQLPDHNRERGLSVIPEDASVRAASPAWGSSEWYSQNPHPGAAFPTPDVPNIIPKGVASGGVAFPVPGVPNIVPSGSSNAGFPQPEIPNIVPKGGVSGSNGVAFPAPEVPNIVGRGPTPGVGAAFPEPEIPNIIPKGGYTPGGSGLEFPQPGIPNIVGRGAASGGAAFPEPEVPNIVPRGGPGGYTPGGGAEFPTPEVPNIVPKGTAGRYTPGGGAAFPTPEVPNIIPKGGFTPGGGTAFPTPEVPNIVPKGTTGRHTPGGFPNPEIPNIVGRGEGPGPGPSVAFPTADVPNIIPKGGVSFPTPEIPNIVGKGGPSAPSPSGGNMFPAPEIPNIVGRAGSSQGRHTPGSGVLSFPTPEIPNIVGGGGPSPGSGTGLFPTPEVPNIIPKGATSGGVSFPTAEIPQIVPKPGSSGSAGFPTPHIPNIVPKDPGGGAQFPTPEVPNIVPKGGGSQSSAAFPTPVVPDIVPKGKKGKKSARSGFSAPEISNVLSDTSASIARSVDFPNPEIPNIVPPKGASSAFGGSSPSWPSAQIPTNTGGTPGWPTSSIPGSKPGPSSPYSNPTLLNVSNSGLMRRPSIGSTGSYDVMIQLPSRPPSRSSPNAEQNRQWLSPSHSSAPLPKSQPRGGHNVPTQPNSPVVLTGPMPPGFIPQRLTDANGVSTPIYQPNVLPPMGPPPVIPPFSGSTNIYKNPVNRDRDDPPPSSVFGGAAPVFPHSPAGSIRPLGTPGPTWGTLGGMTPNTTTRDLPGASNRGSVFGGASPSIGAPISMPVPTVPNLEDDNEDAFDRNTSINTKFNAGIGGNNTAAKKKKKKR